MYLWIADRIEKGDAQRIALRAVEYGLSWVMIKLTDGVVNYNIQSGRDYVEPLVAELRKQNISPWGWSYFYGYNIPKETKLAIDRTLAMGVDGFVVNAEKEFKKDVAKRDRSADVRQLMETLRNGLGRLPIGFSSFRFPSYHDLPWKEFLAYSDISMPQVYWFGRTDSVADLKQSVKEWDAIRKLPMVPTGWAYPESTYSPTVEQIDAFDAAVQAAGYPAVSWWEWYGAVRSGFMPAIAKHNWKKSVPAPAQPASNQELLELIKALNGDLAGLDQSLQAAKAKLTLLDAQAKKVSHVA